MINSTILWHFLGQMQDKTPPANGPVTGGTWLAWLHYSVADNELWRYGLLLLVILFSVIAGRIVRYIINRAAGKLKETITKKLPALFLQSLAAPAALAVFAGGFFLGRLCLKFQLQAGQTGFSPQLFDLWGKLSSAITALAVAYFIYRLVDIIEHYLMSWAEKTESALAEMLVPIVRKSLRIFIIAISALFIADNILGMDIGALLAAAGVGGLAFALAAKETLSNFFGSLMIFTDRPFQIGERIRVGNFDGPVEDVGFRSTRIRTLDGHLVSIPNSTIASDMLENISKRPYIKRVMNIGITYDTPVEKVERALEIIKDILGNTEEITRNQDLPPRVYFNDFKDFSLNILVIYWFTPPDYWAFQEVNQQINLNIMRAFADEGIEFAFPTQTLYLKNEQ